MNNLFSLQVDTESLSLSSTLIILFGSIFIGTIISLVNSYTNKGRGDRELGIALILLPSIVSMIILLVGSNVARAFSLAGAFSLIRFRSSPGDIKDISMIFLTVAVGLACGMGFVVYALIFALIILLVLIVIEKSNLLDKKNQLVLKINTPEDMNNENVFNKILENYCDSYELVGIRSKEFGSVFELNYSIILENENMKKNLLDDIRIKNANLAVNLYRDDF
ncbi:DUF4956 domain-containing protein [uncultured Anaerococcus sp.]|uniref:DUF4956 domain-containing protein n=1 Tax=uncultured Anaerococcus sp. TaxID=293428 RepID=UPI002635F6B6|nr:DUF4956 domain-containing protein [uncultured Anaerococcus sp.]